MTKVVLNVEGMSCMHCVNAVKRAVGSLKGVAETTVDLAGKKVIVEFDPALVSINSVKEAIVDQGYSVV
jgi:copper chaperone